MTPACTTWCIKWRIFGRSYWLNTISSTMITFWIFFSSCTLSFRLPCFGSSNFWKLIFHKAVQQHVLGVVKSLMTVLSQIFQRVCQWRNYENPLRIDYVIDMSFVYQFFWNTVYIKGSKATNLVPGSPAIQLWCLNTVHMYNSRQSAPPSVHPSSDVWLSGMVNSSKK